MSDNVPIRTYANQRKLVRSHELLMTKYMKVTADIKFIKFCKVEKIILTFAKVNLSTKSGSKKLMFLSLSV